MIQDSLNSAAMPNGDMEFMGSSCGSLEFHGPVFVLAFHPDLGTGLKSARIARV
jgi:hypothetical protein